MIWKLRRLASYIRSDIPYGVRNLYRWFPIVWEDRDWDWYHLANIMRFKLKNMAHLQDNGMHVGAEKIARDMRAVAHDLKFLMDDDEDYVFEPEYNKHLAKRHNIRKKEALERIGKTISKEFLKWWD